MVLNRPELGRDLMITGQNDRAVWRIQRVSTGWVVYFRGKQGNGVISSAGYIRHHYRTREGARQFCETL